MRTPSRSYVGRTQVLTWMADRVDALAEGEGSIVLLAGEPGIGKTRTAEELTRMALARGLATHVARCGEAPGMPALWPWSQALPSLASRLPDDEGDRWTGTSAEAFPPGQLVREAGRLIDAAAREDPYVLIFEDLHASDSASAELLASLVPVLRGAPVLCLVTYRPAELRSEQAAASTVAALARQGRTVSLPPLDESEVEELARTATSDELPAALVRSITERSGGNPLFVTQLMALIEDDPTDSSTAARRVREDLPEGIMQVIHEHFARLAPNVGETLRTAAVIGRDFQLDILAAACGEAPDAVARSLDTALARGLVREGEAPRRFRFGHVLVRDVLYADLPASERRERHAAVAEALHRHRDVEREPWLLAVAHHSLAGGLDPRLAAERTLRAAESARARHAPERASDLATRALERLEERPGHDDVDLRVALLCLLGEVHRLSGRETASRQAYAQAIDLARIGGDATTLAEAILGATGRRRAGLDVDAGSAALLSEGLAALDPAPSALRAELSACLGTALVPSDPDRAEAICLEATRCAEAAGDPNVTALALTALHHSLNRPARLADRRPVAARAIQLVDDGRVRDDVEALVRVGCALDSLESGDFASLDRQLRSLGEIADRIGDPAIQWRHRVLRGARVQAQGRLADAEALAEEAIEYGRRAGSTTADGFHALQLFALRREQGRLSELRGSLEELGERFPAVPFFGFARAEAQIAEGRTAEARAFLKATASERFRDLPEDWNFAAIVSSVARLCSEIAAPAAAQALYERLLPAAGTCLVLGIGCAWDGAADLHLGVLAARFGDFEAAARHLHDASTTHARLGARLHLAHTWYELGRLGIVRGRTDELTWIERAADLYRELGLPHLVQRCESLLERRTSHGRDGPSAVPSAPPERLAEEWLADGREQSRLGDRTASTTAFSRVCTIAREARLPIHFARAVLGASGDVRSGTAEQSHDPHRVAEIEEALALLPEAEVELRTRLLLSLALELYWSNDFERVNPLTAEGLGLARASGDAGLVMESLLTAVAASWLPDNRARRMPLCEEACARAMEHGDDTARMVAFQYRALARLEATNLVGADSDLAAAARFSSMSNAPMLEHYLGNVRVIRLLLRGEYGEAEKLTIEQNAEGQRLGAPHIAAMHASHVLHLMLHRGQVAEVLPPLRAMAQTNPLPLTRAGLVYALCLAGERGEANTEIEALLATGLDSFPRNFFFLGTLAYLAESAAHLGRVETLEALYETLAPFESGYILVGFGTNLLGSVDRLLGLLAHGMGRERAAADHLESAVTIERRMDALPFLALALENLADLHESSALGAADRARGLRVEATRIRDRIGLRLQRLPVATGATDDSTPARSTAESASARIEYSRGRGRWTLEYAGRRAVLAEARGLAYLAQLVSVPGADLHVLDLIARVAPEDHPRERSGGAEVLDLQARTELRDRIVELRSELEDAERSGDLGRREQVRPELESVEDALSAALGFGRRSRRAGDPVERARKSVYNRLRASIERVERELPDLGRHLRHSIRTGRTCSYESERPLQWEVVL